MFADKKHVERLPTIKIKTDYRRDSNVVSMVIPLFYSPEGSDFDEDRFQKVVCRGAVWAAISIMENTDLCEKGMPIYFHVEDKIMDTALEVLDSFGVPREWVVETTFDTEGSEPFAGKKYSCFMDASTNVTLLWDTDTFVYRAYGDSRFQWYNRFENELANAVLTSFYSTNTGGDLSYLNWLLKGVGHQPLQGNATLTKMADTEDCAYQELGLSKQGVKGHYGASVLSIPKGCDLRGFLTENYDKTHTCEVPLTLWLNSHDIDRYTLDDMFLPFQESLEVFKESQDSCIVRFDSDETAVEGYFARFKRGLAGHDPSKVRNTGRSRKRFHIIPVPHFPTTKEFSTCAYVQKARKLCLMLDGLGHEVYHYGNELSEVQATENVVVTTEQHLIETYGDYANQIEVRSRALDDYLYKTFYLNTEYELRKRVKPDDFICYVLATYLKPLYESLQDLPVHHVESGIGYYYAYMPYKVFESAAARDFTYGVFQRNYDDYEKMSVEDKEQVNMHATVHYSFPQWQDGIVPNSFDVEDFRFETEKDDYFLYVGRIIRHKGIEEAMRIADACGKKLLIAGQGDFEKEFGFKPWDNVEVLGPVGVEERKELMAKAKLGFCISHYPEPFCGTHIEFALSGTPVITSNFGVFMYTLKHGRTGYRINNFEQGIWAAKNIDKINPKDCREHGLKFSNENVALKYDEYFDSLLRYIKNGKSIYWFENPARTDLDWFDE